MKKKKQIMQIRKIILVVSMMTIILTSCGYKVDDLSLELKHQYALQNSAFAMPKFQTNEKLFDTTYAHAGYIDQDNLEWFLSYYNIENQDEEVTQEEIVDYLSVETQDCPENIEKYINWFDETIGINADNIISNFNEIYANYIVQNKEIPDITSLNQNQRIEIVRKYLNDNYEIDAAVMSEEGAEYEAVVKKYETTELTSLLNTEALDEAKIIGYGISDYDYKTYERTVSEPVTITMSEVKYDENSNLGSYTAVDEDGKVVNIYSYPDQCSGYFNLVFITENGYEMLALMDGETSTFWFNENTGVTDEQLGAVTGMYLLYYGKDGSCQKQLLEVDFEN